MAWPLREGGDKGSATKKTNFYVARKKKSKKSLAPKLETYIAGADVDQADRGVRQADKSGQDGDQSRGQWILHQAEDQVAQEQHQWTGVQ